MKKIMMLGLMLTLALAINPAVVGAYTFDFPNETLVKSYRGYSAVSYNNPNGNINAPSRTWHDVIGDLNNFQTFGADLSNDRQQLTIYTNWGGAAFTTLGAQTADLFIYQGSTVFAVGLRNTRLNNVYDGSSYDTSITWNNYYFPTTTQTNNGVYGGQYGGKITTPGPLPPNAIVDESNAKFVPVQAKGSPIDTTTVGWGTHTPDTDKKWDSYVTIDLADIAGFDYTKNYRFVWATGTCANDTAQGTVPLPGAVLLLGAGLTRLVAYARRRQD
jgi:hypothetical protein